MERARGRSSWRLVWVLAVGLGVLLVACGGVRVEPVRSAVESPRTVRIVAEDSQPGELRFFILNLGKRPLLVKLDAIVVEAYFGKFGRLGDGQGKTITIPPRGGHPMVLRFSAKGLKKGDEVRISFDEALAVEGRAIRINPLPYMVVNRP